MRKTVFFLLALVFALGYTAIFGAPVVRGQVGPCSLRIHCPETSGTTTYYYELEGDNLYRSIRVSYTPGEDAAGDFRDLPPGDYILRCGGIELGRFSLETGQPALELWPNSTWPVSPPK